MYKPSPFSGIAQGFEQLVNWIHGEHVAIARDTVAAQDAVLHKVLYKAPTRAEPGTEVYADGAEWNPGSGEGLYRYSLAGSWVFIG